MKKLTLFAFFDALGWEVYRHYGFMKNRVKDARPLETVFGFSSAADPSILTGAYPEEHQHWSSFFYAPENSPFKSLKMLSHLPQRLVNRWRVRHQLSKLLAKFYGFTGYFEMYSVPFKALPYFDYLEKHDYFVPGGIISGTTMFDQLLAANVPYHCSNWRKSESICRDDLKAEIRKGDIAFAYLYQPRLDGLMHNVGTRHEKVKAKLAEYEQELEAILQLAEEHYDEVAFYAFSDHGMTDVIGTVDLISPVDAAMKAQGFTYGEDYVAMYDSTMARFWFPNPDNASVVKHHLGKVLDAFEEAGQGAPVSPQQLKDWHCDFSDSRFGEWIFLLAPGWLITPSYMGLTAIPGMHGYDPAHADSKAFLISNRTIPEHVKSITDLRSIMVKEVLEQSSPSSPLTQSSKKNLEVIFR